MPDTPRLLHIFSTFGMGGPQMRAVRLFNAWKEKFTHDIVSIALGELSARNEISPSVRVAFPSFPDLKTGNLPARLWSIRKRVAELNPDLVLTYNWGAVEVVMSRRLFGGIPLVHHEDGFGPDESEAQHPRRIWFRRAALPAADRIIVPSRVLERTAREVWRRPAARVSYIPNGVDISAFASDADPATNFSLDRRDGVLQVGTVAGLREEKNLKRLVRVFAAATHSIDARLIIVGEGPERDAIRREAAALGVGHRIYLPGFLPNPERYVGHFDVFALSSDTEQFPIGLVEAMAAKCPAVCTDVGDIKDIASAENLQFIAARDDEDALANAMRTLLQDAGLRRKIGHANRLKVEREFSMAAMLANYERLYRAAMRIEVAN